MRQVYGLILVPLMAGLAVPLAHARQGSVLVTRTARLDGVEALSLEEYLQITDNHGARELFRSSSTGRPSRTLLSPGTEGVGYPGFTPAALEPPPSDQGLRIQSKGVEMACSSLGDPQGGVMMTCTHRFQGEDRAISRRWFRQNHRHPLLVAISFIREDFTLVQAIKPLDTMGPEVEGAFEPKRGRKEGEIALERGETKEQLADVAAFQGNLTGLDYNYDTGWIPSSGALRFRASFEAGLDVTASIEEATFFLDTTNEKLTLGSALGDIDGFAGIDLGARVWIDLPIIGQWDVDLPIVDFSASCSETFDSFLLDTQASCYDEMLRTNLLELDLLDFIIGPIPGVGAGVGIDGALTLRATLSCNEIALDTGPIFTSEGQSLDILLESNNYFAMAAYLEDFYLTLGVVIYPTLYVEISFLGRWDLPLYDFPWDILDTSIDMNLSLAPLSFQWCDCPPGEIEMGGMCELCGQYERICLPDCTWGPFECVDQGECEPFASEQGGGCERCGYLERTCSESCIWDDYLCLGQGACQPGQIELCEGGLCGAGTRACRDDCSWGPCTEASGECNPGQIDESGGPCERCGHRIRHCLPDCSYPEAWECVDQGVCEAGEMEDCIDGDGYPATRLCLETCRWGGCQAVCQCRGGPCCSAECQLVAPETPCGPCQECNAFGICRAVADHSDPHGDCLDGQSCVDGICHEECSCAPGDGCCTDGCYRDAVGTPCDLCRECSASGECEVVPDDSDPHDDCPDGQSCVEGLCQEGCSCASGDSCCTNGCDHDGPGTPCGHCRECNVAGHCDAVTDGTDPFDDCLPGETCLEGSCQVEPCDEEICNGMDDDCDGEVDEGELCGAEMLCLEGRCAMGGGVCLACPCLIGLVCLESDGLAPFCVAPCAEGCSEGFDCLAFEGQDVCSPRAVFRCEGNTIVGSDACGHHLGEAVACGEDSICQEGQCIIAGCPEGTRECGGDCLIEDELCCDCDKSSDCDEGCLCDPDCLAPSPGRDECGCGMVASGGSNPMWALLFLALFVCLGRGIRSCSKR